MSTSINMTDARAMIIAMYEANEPLMLLGKPGMGKTSLFESVCSELKIGFIDFRLSLRDPVDVGGMRVPDAKTGKLRHYIPDDLPDPSKHGPKGIVLFDEINVVSQLMQATAYGIVQERRNGAYRMADGWVPMASGNNVADRAAAQRLSSALGNRFCVQHVEPDLGSWLDQYGSEHVDTRGTAFLRFRPQLFHLMPGQPVRLPGETEDSTPITQGNEFSPFPSARSWTKAFKFIGNDPKFRRKIFNGYVGEFAANEFEAFWRIIEKAVMVEDIVADPLGAYCPAADDPGTAYALVGMLVRELNRKNIDPIMTYTGRLSPEYQAAMVVDAVRHSPDLKKTVAYGKWVVDRQEMTL